MKVYPIVNAFKKLECNYKYENIAVLKNIIMNRVIRIKLINVVIFYLVVFVLIIFLHAVVL